jgi:hypothetical protein
MKKFSDVHLPDLTPTVAFLLVRILSSEPALIGHVGHKNYPSLPIRRRGYLIKPFRAGTRYAGAQPCPN